MIARLLADADRFEAEGDAALDRGDAEAGKRLLDRAIVRREAAEVLRAADDTRTIRSMRTDSVDPAVKRAAGRSRRKHPAQAKLYAQGVTITALAAELGEKRARVSAWMADPSGDANRPIPRHHAERLRARYGIPLSAWARIGD